MAVAKRIVSFLMVLLLSMNIQAGVFQKVNGRKLFFGGAIISICAIMAYSVANAVNSHPSRMRWDWENIEITPEVLSFNNEKMQDNFLWGVATSAYQVEGDDGAKVVPYNQWQRCEEKEIKIAGENCRPVPHISGKACEHWTRYKEDIQTLKKLGFNSFRISISWGKVEPQEGVFNQNALEHYENVCKEMAQNGIKPVVTLHHYTHPCWFEDKGGFEKEENIGHFVCFCEKIFERLKKYVHLWFTFNTFVGFAMAGYSQGLKPPFKKDMALAMEVLKNLLEAHVRVYDKFKGIDKNTKVGIYKNIFHLDSWNMFNPLDLLFSSLGNHISNNLIYNFFKTGVFNIWIPKKVSMHYENKNAIGALDFIGLNYYSGAFVRNFKIIPRPECIPTANARYTIYPEGFYRALLQVSDKLAKPIQKIKNQTIPIYVTENGIAALQDSDRDIFYKRYLFALSKAMQEGVDVRGYITWSLMDNYEWASGYKIKYGICEVDFDTQERKLKNGTQFLIDVINTGNFPRYVL